MFRVSHCVDGIDDADTIEGAHEVVRGQPTGCRGDLFDAISQGNSPNGEGP
jgi:hypothetical protein